MRSRAAVTLVAGVLGLLAAPTGGAASAALAVSLSGSDANACTPAAPCRSFDRAYRAALPGQVVQVAGGVYPAQTIWQDPQKTSLADVVFQPAAGATVTVSGTLNIYGRHVELRSMSFSSGWYARQGAEDVTFRNTRTRTFSIGSVQGLAILGGEVGPLLASTDVDPKISKSSSSSTFAPTDVTIDGTAFHDIVREPGSGLHVECLQVGAATGLVVRNSSFERCSTQSLFVSSWGAAYPLRNVTVEDNVFGAVPEGFHSVKINVSAGGAPCESCSVAGNRASKPIAVNVERSGSSILVTANRMPSADLWAPGWCDHGLYGVVWDRNEFEQRPTCGSNAVVVGTSP